MHPYWRDHPWRLRVAALGVVGVLVALFQTLVPAPLAGAEEVLGDLTWRFGATKAPERRVVIVDIDEASLREVGPWPWPRETIAKLANGLGRAGAAVQAYDLVFDAARDGDGVLGEQWATLPVVAGQILTLDPTTTPAEGQVAGALATPGCPAFAPQASGYIGNSRDLRPEGLTVGHLTPRMELDGVVRKVPAVVCHQGRAYPSLAMAALWKAVQSADLRRAPDWTWQQNEVGFGGPFGLAPHAWLTSASLPGVRIPVDKAGDMRVPYRIDRAGLASVSAYKVLDGSADAALLRGSVVLIGATAFGLGDVTATPLSSVASGLEVHALSIAGLLDHAVPFEPRQSQGLQVLAMLVMGGLLLWVTSRRVESPVKRLPLIGLALALASHAAAAALLLQADLWIPWLAPALFALLGSTALATAEHALTRAQRQRLSAHLGSYLPAPVAARLAASDPSGSIQVTRRDVSVLVADIRNFSAFAAHREPEETAALLHAFYCIAVDVVEQHGGVVENVVGDSVMAVWNAYSNCSDHPAEALQAAKELLRATRALLANPQGMTEDPRVQPLALGVGLERGQAIVGSFGPQRRRAHAALGEPVSVASRIQQMTQDLSMPILLGPQLASSLPPGTLEGMGDYLLEGLSQQYSIHAPADWVDLVPADQLWVNGTTTKPHLEDEGGWASAVKSGSPLGIATAVRRDA